MGTTAEILLTILKNAGFLAFVATALGAVIMFFIHRNLKREDHLQAQIDELNREIREIVVPLAVQSKEMLSECKEAIRQNSAVILRLAGGSRR